MSRSKQTISSEEVSSEETITGEVVQLINPSKSPEYAVGEIGALWLRNGWWVMVVNGGPGSVREMSAEEVLGKFSPFSKPPHVYDVLVRDPDGIGVGDDIEIEAERLNGQWLCHPTNPLTGDVDG